MRHDHQGLHPDERAPGALRCQGACGSGGALQPVRSSGKLQERRDPAVPEVRASRKRLRAEIPVAGESRRERKGRPPVVPVPEGQAALPQRRPHVPHGRPQVHHLESRLPERHLLELREVPHRARRGAFQEVQPQLPDQQHRGRHHQAPQPGQVNRPSVGPTESG